MDAGVKTGVAAVERGIHCGGINKRLEDRSRRTLRDRVIQLAEAVIPSADQRQHFAGVRIQRNQRHLRLRARSDLWFRYFPCRLSPAWCAAWSPDRPPA